MPAPCDKYQEIVSVKNDHFYKFRNKTYNIDKSRKHLNYLFSIKEELKLPVDAVDEKSFVLASNKVYKAIAKPKDLVSHYLLRGTINCFIGSIVENSFYCKTKQDVRHRLSIGIGLFNKLIDDIYRGLEDDPFSLDDTRSKIISKIVQEQEKGGNLD